MGRNFRVKFCVYICGGLAADFLETRFRRPLALILTACFALRAVLTVMALITWVRIRYNASRQGL